jgi:hypothetical protein
MAKYFNYFPTTLYNLDEKNSSLETVTNIIARFGFEQKLKENSSAFYEYEIKDSDTPEIIAHKYYGNSERHWIVLMFNNIVDPQWDWPLEYRTFNEFVDTKYSSSEYADTANTSVSGLSWAKNQSNVQAYLKIITVQNTLEGINSSQIIEVDSAQYSNIAVTTTVYTLPNSTTITEKITKQIKTYYDYENELNESKRKIKLIKPEFVSEIEKEFKRVIRI